LSRLLQVFVDEKIDFVVVGGFAGVLHGSSLLTQDLDLCLLLTPNNVAKLRSILKDFHPKHRMTPKRLSFLEVPEDTSRLNNLYLETDLGTVDLISQVTGVGDFERVSRNAVKVELFGHSCKVISIEDLIRAKEAIGREKDIAMVKQLKVILEKLNGKA
jgi:predicted nucleotidyltransferase